MHNDRWLHNSPCSRDKSFRFWQIFPAFLIHEIVVQSFVVFSFHFAFCCFPFWLSIAGWVKLPVADQIATLLIFSDSVDVWMYAAIIWMSEMKYARQRMLENAKNDLKSEIANGANDRTRALLKSVSLSSAYDFLRWKEQYWSSWGSKFVMPERVMPCSLQSS